MPHELVNLGKRYTEAEVAQLSPGMWKLCLKPLGSNVMVGSHREFKLHPNIRAMVLELKVGEMLEVTNDLDQRQYRIQGLHTCDYMLYTPLCECGGLLNTTPVYEELA